MEVSQKIKHEIVIPIGISFFLAGIALEAFFKIPFYLLSALFGIYIGVCIVGVAARYINMHLFSRSLAVVCIVAGFFILGAWRFSLFEESYQEDNFYKYYSENISISGSVYEVSKRSRSITMKVKTPEGKLSVVASRYPEYRYGDIVFLSGVVSKPEAYDRYDVPHALAKDDIYAEMIFPHIEKTGFAPPSRIIARLTSLRLQFEHMVQMILSEPHASLVNGMLLGDEGVLDPGIIEAFRKSGTVHILVLSGFNITVVGAFIILLFSYFFSLRVAWICGAIGIVSFTVLTGAQAPAVRAAIMALIGLIVLHSGRNALPFLSLMWAVFGMLLWNPAFLLWDRGFQLSFLATFGLISFSSFMSRRISFLPRTFGIRESVSMTFSAQLFVLPLLLSWGGVISVASPIANIIIVGLVPSVMLFGFFGGLFTFFSMPLARMIAAVPYVLVSFQIAVAKFFANVFPALSFNYIPHTALILIYALLFYFAARLYREDIRSMVK